ncbi:DoxX family membrane protein [Phototrophicus methaneseepsis]|uniref:DoxX family membrane protein n=1 Tax=Phototrophicus methaneseepsis TaxID=2710758 RepID=A0A7S8ICH0_9CHLR|nr:DoxX family membrane protein [Phototrophicus methaneseepsis]QPC80517.1 DoxX family membrane protein [Phototrophicus methaneseepsis]
MNALLNRKQNRVIDEPNFVKQLLSSPRFAILWLIVRVLLGLQWIEAGSHKVSEAAWTQTGLALKGYWESAVAIPEAGRPAISYDWYRAFLQGLLDAEAYTWFAKLIAYGEVLVGIALIVGAFVGIAAFCGALMNFNFMLAGSASTNPVLFTAAIALILAWKVAGYIGADYFLLNWIGTPWNRKAVANDASPAYSPAAGD